MFCLAIKGFSKNKYFLNCNCNGVLFNKLPWPEESDGIFRSSSQAATCLPHTVEASHCPLIVEYQARKLWIPIFIIFGLTRPGIEPESIVSEANALSKIYSRLVLLPRKKLVSHCFYCQERNWLHTVPLIVEYQARKLWIPIFIIFGLTRPGIEPESIVSEANALSKNLFSLSSIAKKETS